ncbi:hypothetical protein B0H16DRAFT_45512 [Mycena metata]|uniref:Uncharacterized protein n=1 Tax=Mycena metata TaxID=1033252 RepID=A0AAD7NUD6_9AGAR|nr:hypothetical protein B0H16DRAFT_45512 [Mycena metata]
MSISFGTVIYQGMFCLGMIWRMNPLKMPRGFCVAQAILMNIACFILNGLTVVFCIAMHLHTLKPRQWGDVSAAFEWRPIYILPVVVYPLATSIAYVTLFLRFNAVQATEGMACDATNPMWIQLVGQTMPAALLAVPAFWLSISSLRRVRRTTEHIERARRGEHEAIRQIRRDRQGGHHSFQLSEPPAIFNGSSSPGRPTPDIPVAGSSRPGFRIPFLRQLTNTSPPPSINSLPDDGRSSIASSSFPTFAAPAKPGFADQGAGNDLGVAESPWVDAESTAPTSNEGHESSAKALTFDVKTQSEAEDNALGLNYRENAATPSRVSYLAHVQKGAPQLQRVIFAQIGFPFFLILYALSPIVEIAMHRQQPTSFGSQNIFQLVAAVGGALVFAPIPSVRVQLGSVLAFWRR